jgi:hypothetical protein
MESMSKVVASNNLKAAAENEGQALLITKTKAAEAEGNSIKISAQAEKEAAQLRGQGVALFRQEVAKGMTEAAEEMKQANLDTNVILFSMWTEAIKNFAEYGKTGLYNQLALGFGLGTLAIVLHLTGLLPCNKLLWSPTFVAATGAISILILALLTSLEDKVIWLSDYFEAIGVNPILIYTLSEVLEHLWHFKIEGKSLVKWFNFGLTQISPFPYVNSLIWPLLLITFFLILGKQLKHRNIILKV